MTRLCSLLQRDCCPYSLYYIVRAASLESMFSLDHPVRNDIRGDQEDLQRSLWIRGSLIYILSEHFFKFQKR